MTLETEVSVFSFGFLNGLGLVMMFLCQFDLKNVYLEVNLTDFSGTYSQVSMHRVIAHVFSQEYQGRGVAAFLCLQKLFRE